MIKFVPEYFSERHKVHDDADIPFWSAILEALMRPSNAGTPQDPSKPLPRVLDLAMSASIDERSSSVVETNIPLNIQQLVSVACSRRAQSRESCLRYRRNQCGNDAFIIIASLGVNCG